MPHIKQHLSVPTKAITVQKDEDHRAVVLRIDGMQGSISIEMSPQQALEVGESLIKQAHELDPVLVGKVTEGMVETNKIESLKSQSSKAMREGKIQLAINLYNKAWEMERRK
jgi:CheY-specific phosphatase CheX